MKTCNNCNAENQNVSVPYVAHESAMARSERHNKRLWIVILVLIGALIGTNLAWIIYENSFEDYVITQDVEQDGDNGTNNFVGGDYSERRTGRGYSRDEATDWMMTRLGEMMSETDDPKQRETLKKCMRELERD